MNLLEGAVILLFMWIYIYMYRYRVFITKYTGTTTSLASGMIIGFVSAVSFALQTESHDDASTVLSLIISMLAGMLIGAAHSFSAWAAGALGGLISAPLGTMVASLLSFDRMESFITALLLLSIGFIIGLLSMITMEIPAYYNVAFRKAVLNPITIGLPLILLFYVYEGIEKMFATKFLVNNKT